MPLRTVMVHKRLLYTPLYPILPALRTFYSIESVQKPGAHTFILENSWTPGICTLSSQSCFISISSLFTNGLSCTMDGGNFSSPPFSCSLPLSPCILFRHPASIACDMMLGNVGWAPPLNRQLECS